VVKTYALIVTAFLISGVQLLSTGCSSANKKSILTRMPSGEPGQLANVHSLKAVVAGDYYGFDMESDEFKADLKLKAEKFIKFRSSHDASYIKACAESNQKDPYCSFIKKYVSPDDEDLPSEGESIKARAKEKRRQYAAYKKKLVNGELDDFKKINAGAIREVFDSIKSYSLLEKGFESVQNNTCKNIRLSYYLAAKIEEFFPDSQMKQKAISLYAKVAQCKHEVYEPAAKYRLSLLKIWEGKCDEVISDLEYLTAEHKKKTYRSRALYWTYHCQKALTHTEAANKAAQTLLDDHPFSLHTLLVDKAYSDQLRTAAVRADSALKFRSTTKPILNNAILAAEGLLSLKKKNTRGYVTEILTSVTVEMEEAEPEVQLYGSLLFNRAGNNIGKFKFLAPLFRDHPEMISRPALELFYPIRDLNDKVMESVGLDEFLVISLIRQESAFNETAKSGAGAVGLMQLMPATARIKKREALRRLVNPELNVKLGSKHFAYLMRRYKGDTELALAAYNAGSRPVDEWKRRYPVHNRVLMVDLFPFRETREYVGNIARNYYWYTVLYSGKKQVPQLPIPATDPSDVSTPEELQDVTAQLESVFKLFGS